jgi:hypothetical protein
MVPSESQMQAFRRALKKIPSGRQTGQIQDRAGEAGTRDHRRIAARGASNGGVKKTLSDEIM